MERGDSGVKKRAMFPSTSLTQRCALHRPFRDDTKRWHRLWIDRGDGRFVMVWERLRSCEHARREARNTLRDEPPVVVDAELHCSATRFEAGADGDRLCVRCEGLTWLW
jgi:hypothetical protein